MTSTTYRHLGDVNKMYAAQEQFRDLTKMVCARFRDLTKTYHLGNVTVMVRNAGQLPQPFWLPVAAARIVFPPALQGLNAEQIKAVIKRAPLGRYDRKIARLRYVDQLCQVDIAARVPYCRTSIGNRLKIIDKILDV